jgi:hypothetical protein
MAAEIKFGNGIKASYNLVENSNYTELKLSN